LPIGLFKNTPSLFIRSISDSNPSTPLDTQLFILAKKISANFSEKIAPLFSLSVVFREKKRATIFVIYPKVC